MLVEVSLQLIRFYRLVAPQKRRACCRYEPSCSEYAVLALNKYGFWSGWRRALGRIYRCRYPYGGEDYP
ncbi:membrane protein insertion efficiency factor YidD [Halomonas daqingensis]|uniref:membrane protein insertion efficiency factor YidD n=1 Tax=Billgrantia desiderata TaxID=52021 RepID=UPI001F3E07CF|nr:membrane protein insertion efficiency factor YidD [Halomonas desiderata]MCE8028827.1 membrane protein insertion efficiency factor YidD [Halomonas desiderata]